RQRASHPLPMKDALFFISSLLPFASCLLPSLSEAVLLFGEARVVNGEVVFDLCDGDDREVVALSEGELHAVNLAVILEVGLVLANEEARLRVEVEARRVALGG